MPTTTVFTADAGSVLNDGSGPTPAWGASQAIGGIAPNDFIQARFVTSTLASADTILGAKLQVKISATGGANSIPLTVWAADFGTGAIDATDYVLTANNNTAGYRVPLYQIFGASAVTGDVGTLVIPTRYIKKGTGALTDLEIRPTVAVTTSTQTTSLAGPTAATTADRPTLTVITATDAELRGGRAYPYRFQGVGAESYLAFGRETYPGLPVKGKVLLDFNSSTFDSMAVNLQSNSLNAQRSRPRKIALGREGAGGDFSIDLTPEKCWGLLTGFMKKVGTTTGSAPYTHLFKNARTDEITTFTFVEKKGPMRSVFPGAMLSSMTISSSLDEIVNASVSAMARTEYQYTYGDAGNGYDEYVLSPTAGYDTVDNSVLSFIGALVTFDGITDNSCVQNFSITLSQDVNERRGLNRRRSVSSHFALSFTAEISFTMYFENDVQIRKFLGVNNTDGPFAAGKNILFQQVQFRLAGMDEDNQEVVITVPKMLYTTVRKPIGSDGAIMLECSGVAVYKDTGTLFDNTGGQSSIQIEVKNAEPSTVYDPSTEYITVLPPNKSWGLDYVATQNLLLPPVTTGGGTVTPVTKPPEPNGTGGTAPSIIN